MKNYSGKSSIEEIRERFDNDVERFANLDTGQKTTIDASFCLDLITDAASYVNTDATDILDIGCGAGNYTLKMLTKLPGLNCTMIDLSLPMLERAKSRVSGVTSGEVHTLQSDIRLVDFGEGKFDIIVAGAVLHHLRDDSDWEFVFAKIYSWLKPGGSFWISDLIEHESEAINKLFITKYGDYIESLGGVDYRKHVLDYVQKEDSPRSLNYQLNLMKKVGFGFTEVLHKNMCFAAFGGVKLR
ncbi:MAG: SAM-dependent methyltransferase [Daejeonella sp.]|nr:SAM-dependent methyltransferase [Daejeonella sp.]